MSVFSKIKGVLLGSLIVLPSLVQAQAAAGSDCWRADEVEAAKFEDFRLMLKVGALNCAARMPAAAESYNGFMQRKKDFILSNLYVVRAHFVREVGATDGATAFANYETLEGNKYSNATYDVARCEKIDAYARIAGQASDADLMKLVAVLSPGLLPSGCKVAPRSPEAAAIVEAVTPLVVPSPAPAVVAAPVPTLHPALAVAAAPSGGPMTEAASTAATRRLLAARAAERAAIAAPKPAPVAAAAPAPVAAPAPAVIAPAPAAPSPAAAQAQALAEAARALAAVAAAMQTQAAPATN